ncbi:MAG: hypothetical protein HWD61_03330 [Parachlamydiaceae bacterium]|nr:MAG: hypothetical protein HWD61_03330 [Parachlamydiaceae bacterium]
MNTQVSERISGIQPTPFVLSAESADILQHLKKSSLDISLNLIMFLSTS